MLIRSVRGQNFMRFESVVLDGLPRRGMIAIEGPNESGKTTIGELLFFAFFGHSRSAERSSVADLIRWGAQSMAVEVEFSAADRAGETNDYLIYREVDREGTNYVKLLELPSRRAIATGNVAVNEFLAREVRFDACEFQRSFYYDQHEDRRFGVEGSQVSFFERATGISHLAAAIERIRESTAAREAESAACERDLARYRDQIARLEKIVGRRELLEEKSRGLESDVSTAEGSASTHRKHADAERAEAKRLQGDAALLGEAVGDRTIASIVEDLERVVVSGRAASEARPDLHADSRWRESLEPARRKLDDFHRLVRETGELTRLGGERLERLEVDLAPDGLQADAERCRVEVERARSSGTRSLVLGIVGGLLFLAGIGTIVAIAQGLVDFGEQNRNGMIAGGTAGGLGLVLVLLAAWRGSASSAALRRVEERRSETSARLAETTRSRDSLSAALDRAKGDDLARVVGELKACGDATIADRAAKLSGDWQSAFGESDLWSVRDDLAKSYRSLRGKLLDDASKNKKKATDDDRNAKNVRGELDRARKEVAECEAQASRLEAVRRRAREAEEDAARLRSRVARDQAAIRLLEETIQSVRAKVAPAVRAHLREVLPRLTAGRYRDVRVDDDLRVRVFSSEKSDFLSLSELSGGTGEALGLAVRLALAQTFVSSRVRRAQFVFLDEPFKMMDAERSAATLGALRALSPDLCQVFVAQPTLPDSTRGDFDLLIETRGAESDEDGGVRLVVEGDGAGFEPLPNGADASSRGATNEPEIPVAPPSTDGVDARGSSAAEGSAARSFAPVVPVVVPPPSDEEDEEDPPADSPSGGASSEREHDSSPQPDGAP